MVWRYRDVLIALLAACDGADLEPDADPSPDASDVARWRFETPAIDLVAAEENYYCSYHQIPGDLGPVGRVAFYGLAGVHDLALEVIPGPVDDGAVDQICARPTQAAMVFSLDAQLGELVFPDDAPLLLGDGLAVVVRIHFLNPDDAPRRSYGIVSWYSATLATSRTSGLLASIRTDFSVPPGATTIDTSCMLAPGARLVGAYPVSNARGYRLTIADDSGTLVSTFNWAHPPRASWVAPFYQPTGRLQTRCEYLNDTGQIVNGGERTFIDERCGMSALIVPGTGLSSCAP